MDPVGGHEIEMIRPLTANPVSSTATATTADATAESVALVCGTRRVRAVAAVESWWRMSANGDNGDSFGLFQIRRPFHCCDFLAANDTAFNADYYGAILRAFYDGRQGWSIPPKGIPYRAHDLWGSVGAWFSGRWHDPGAERYIVKVKQELYARDWRQPGF